MSLWIRLSKQFGRPRFPSSFRDASPTVADQTLRTFESTIYPTTVVITTSILCFGSIYSLIMISTTKQNDGDDDVHGSEATNYQQTSPFSFYTSNYSFVNKRNTDYTSTEKATNIHPFLYTKCDAIETVEDAIANNINNNNNNNANRIIFLGSGSSTGCPRPLCPLLFSDIVNANTSNNTVKDRNNDKNGGTLTPELMKLRETMFDQCRTSIMASIGDPIQNKDYRNNPSLLISIVAPTTTTTTTTTTTSTGQHPTQRYNIIIDVGKTFREGAIRWLPKYHIPTIDAIVLTHQHMDAVAGLDDVRGFQKYQIITPDDNSNTTETETSSTRKRQAVPMPLYVSDLCLVSLQDQFPWLLPKLPPPKQQINQNATASLSSEQPIAIQRHVASFDVNVFEPFQSFEPVPGFKITPLPLIHGEDLISYGFAFSLGGTMNVVYLSDISRMLPETLDYILNTLPQPTHVLILDALLIDSTNPVHYCLPQSLDLIQQLQPLQTYLVGMNCDSFGPHDERNEQLRNDYGNVQLAHDGLVIDAPTVNESK